LAFSAQVLRILIASPSDVQDEREITTQVIQEWNDQNSADRQVVLLPLRWETHSAPSIGRPQEIINQQVVDHCDLVIGIFWSRLGTPTGKADSGTLEEIERVIKSGMPVMIYFSKAKQDIDDIDPDQLARLRQFKKDISDDVLLSEYSTQIEFKENLLRQLDIQIKSLMSSDSSDSGVLKKGRSGTDICLEFAEPETGVAIGTSCELTSQFINITDFEFVPNYKQKTEKKHPKAQPGQALPPPVLGTSLHTYISDYNTDYYRQYLTFIIQQQLFVPIRFWLKNIGSIGARDVYVDFTVRSEDDFLCKSKTQLPTSVPSKIKSGGLLGGGYHFSSPEAILKESSNSWNYAIEQKALQPKREISPEVNLFIAASKSTDIEITARIYADTLAEPEVHTLSLKLNVEKVDSPYTSVISEEFDE